MAIDIKKFIVRFIEEARDHINQLNEGLAALEAGRADQEGINTIFRSAHTIKGSSRMLKLVTIQGNRMNAIVVDCKNFRLRSIAYRGAVDSL